MVSLLEGVLKVKESLRDHLVICVIITVFASIYLTLPLSLQACEVYDYAAAIEKYYRNSVGFSLSQGFDLPDFGRYHPNHPLGHVLAAGAYDFLSIPAMTWLKFSNITGAIMAGIFLYLLQLQMKIFRALSAAAVAFFLGTYCGLFTVLSGEWHMPALALSLGAYWQLVKYSENRLVRHLYIASVLFSAAVCYHLAAFFYVVPLTIGMLACDYKKRDYQAFLISGLIVAIPMLLVYVIVPFIIFSFQSFEEFKRTFFAYKHLSHARYDGLDWLVMAARTICHSFVYSLATNNLIYIFSLFFMIVIALASWAFCYLRFARIQSFLVVGTPIWWIGAHWVTGARPDALLGWLFALPFLCIVFIQVLSRIRLAGRFLAYSIPFAALFWNVYAAILPNSLSRPENASFVAMPKNLDSNTPIAFVVSHPVLTQVEIWHTGSKLGFRNQTHFMPCCGENNYFARLKRWTSQNPGFVIIADGRHDAIENFLASQKIPYKRWLDVRADWPSTLVPTTLFVQHKAAPFYRKSLTIWVPTSALMRE